MLVRSRTLSPVRWAAASPPRRLTLGDVGNLSPHFEHNRFSATSGRKIATRRTPRRHRGRRDGERVEFLLDRRVELNAFTSDRFVVYVERKLIEHSVRKVVPSKTLLQQTYRAIAHGHLAKPAVERAIAEATKTRVAVPPDLRERVAAFLEDNPECPWDVAVAKITRGEQ